MLVPHKSSIWIKLSLTKNHGLGAACYCSNPKKSINSFREKNEGGISEGWGMLQKHINAHTHVKDRIVHFMWEMPDDFYIFFGIVWRIIVKGENAFGLDLFVTQYLPFFLSFSLGLCIRCMRSQCCRCFTLKFYVLISFHPPCHLTHSLIHSFIHFVSLFLFGSVDVQQTLCCWMR